MAKLHIKSCRTEKSLCGVEMPENTAWIPREESCETCTKIHAANISRAVERMIKESKK